MLCYDLCECIPESQIIKVMDDRGNCLWKGTSWALFVNKDFRNQPIISMIAVDDGIIEVEI